MHTRELTSSMNDVKAKYAVVLLFHACVTCTCSSMMYPTSRCTACTEHSNYLRAERSLRLRKEVAAAEAKSKLWDRLLLNYRGVGHAFQRLSPSLCGARVAHPLHKIHHLSKGGGGGVHNGCTQVAFFVLTRCWACADHSPLPYCAAGFRRPLGRVCRGNVGCQIKAMVCS